LASRQAVRIDAVIDQAVHGVFNERPEHNASDDHDTPLDKRELGETGRREDRQAGGEQGAE
jgi:hypothetical protein